MSQDKFAGTVLLAAVLTAGCAKVIMENTSPVQAVPSVEAFRTIPLTVLVKPGKPGDLVHNDVAKALKDAKVFKNVETNLSEGEKADLELVVTYESRSDGHFAAEMFKAILIGLTLSTTQGLAADKHDYSVTIRGTLSRGDREIGQYEATGSYHSEMPESRAIGEKVEHVKKNTQLSWDHALALLTASIQQDRDNIAGRRR